jgi:hypothetical protein
LRSDRRWSASSPTCPEVLCKVEAWLAEQHVVLEGRADRLADYVETPESRDAR